MNDRRSDNPLHGNWVSSRLLLVPGVLSAAFIGMSFLRPLLGIAAFVFLLIFGYFAYARYVFSPRGWNLQNRIQDLVVDHLEWDGIGRAIDIGCGSGSLTIKVALKYSNAEISGIDNWSGHWEYSAGKCRRNAEIEGVADRTSFQSASASAIPFEDETFDLAVSNLTFHEVRDTRDKKALLREALRVVKEGGAFVFQDLFLWKVVYGEIDELLETVKGWGVRKVAFAATNDREFIPGALKLPFMVGTMGILYGVK